jgi:cytoskeleton protein RodZ
MGDPSVATSVDSVPKPILNEDEVQAASRGSILGVNLLGHQSRIYGERNRDARIIVKANNESWVQIMSKEGELLLTRILRPGDQYLVPNREDLYLMTGNAGGIEISVDGQPVPAIGQSGAVRGNVALVPDRLTAGTAVEP